MALGSQLVFPDLRTSEANVVSSYNPLPVRIAGEEESQFGEVIAVVRTPIIELNGVYGISAVRDITATAGSGQVTDATSEIQLSTGATASSEAELWSAERGRYIPGYGAQCGVGIRIPVDPTGNQYAEWGLQEPTGQDGFGFGRDATGLYVWIRKAGSQTVIRQDSWNLDKLDGTGDSGVELDVTDGQVYQIEFTYYGYGEIRFGILGVGANFQQRFIACHSARVRNETSTNQPNLPVYVGAYNGADAADFDVFVGGRQYSIIGEYVPKLRTTGQENFGVGSVGTATSVPIVSFRTKTGFEDRSIKLDNVFGQATTNDIMLEVYIGTTLTGTPAWNNPTNATAAETSLEVDVAATGFTGGVLVWNKPVLAGVGTVSNSISETVNIDLPENQVITLAARSLNGTATVDGYMRLTEEW